jgi:hypothetical protein
MKKYLVYYKKYPFEPVKQMTEEEFAEEYTLLMELKAKDMNDVFWQMQGEVWSPNGEARQIIKDFGLTHTSMMSQDVIYDAEKDAYFMVKPIGFEQINLSK